MPRLVVASWWLDHLHEKVLPSSLHMPDYQYISCILLRASGRLPPNIFPMFSEIMALMLKGAYKASVTAVIRSCD